MPGWTRPVHRARACGPRSRPRSSASTRAISAHSGFSAFIPARSSACLNSVRSPTSPLASRRLRLAGTDRPIGELTCKVLREWLEYRQRRWPHTANPHLLVSKESALRHGPVSTAFLTSLRGLPATLERLRIDCQLTEAMATGFDPLHLAQDFGISDASRDPLRGQRPAPARIAALTRHRTWPRNGKLVRFSGNNRSDWAGG